MGRDSNPRWDFSHSGFQDRRPTPQNTRKNDDSEAQGSAAGSAPSENQPIPADLQAVIDAWPALPEAIQAGILAMIRAAGNA